MISALVEGFEEGFWLVKLGWCIQAFNGEQDVVFEVNTPPLRSQGSELFSLFCCCTSIGIAELWGQLGPELIVVGCSPELRTDRVFLLEGLS